ncbi:MAG: elongation factor G [Geminicoccaceae bacterium]
MEPEARAAQLGLPDEGQPVVQILKNLYLPHTGKLSLARIWRGSVKEGTAFGDMRIGGVYRLLGASSRMSARPRPATSWRWPSWRVPAPGPCSAEPAPGLPQPPAPRPMYAFALTAANRNDEVKLSAAFAKLTDEDPSLQVEQERETHQTVLWGQGEVHLKVALDRLKQKYNVELQPHAPRTPYRETIRKGTHAHGRHKKQSGGHGQFADVKLEIRPLGRGEGFQFENKVVGGAVPRQFIPAVEAGAREFLDKGPLGFPVVDVAVTLNDGQFHSVDSNELSFKLATAAALKEGLPSCEPVLLEPVLQVTLSVPTDYTAKVLQLVSGKRGQILGYEAKDGWRGWDEISAQIPQGEIHDLVVSLRSLTQGTGFFDWAYDHLQEVPDRLAQAIVGKHGAAAA